MNYKASITKYLQAVSKGIVEAQDKKGIKASGDSARSLTVEAGENSGELSGRGYFEQQDQGRGPTKNGGPGLVRRAILAWLKVKPWSKGFDDKKQESLSWAISKNIHKYGTKRGRDPKYPGLGLQAIEEKERKPFIISIAGNNAKRFSAIFKLLKG